MLGSTRKAWLVVSERHPVSASSNRFVLTTGFIEMALGCSDFLLLDGEHHQGNPQAMHYW